MTNRLNVPASLPISGNGATVAVSTPLIDGSQTWNNAATDFVGAGIDITDNASGNLSVLFRTRYNGALRMSVDKFGNVTANAAAGGFVIAGDTILRRDAPNTLALRNGTSVQTFNVYNTYTDASNYETGYIKWTSNSLFVGTGSAGTGVARTLTLATNGSGRWTVDTSGHLAANVDNAYDIGASAASRPRNLFTAGYYKGQITVVGSLPAAATAGAGARSFVTDALLPVFGSAVAGGGAVNVPVYSNGSTWMVG